MATIDEIDVKDAVTPTLRPNSAVHKLAPYKQGQSVVLGHENPIKLSSNESTHGPSPLALKAYHDAGERLFRYPDGNQTDLRAAIGDVFSLDPNQVICGNGSEELQLLLVRAFVSPGEDVICSENSFVMGRIHAAAQGANVLSAPEPNHHASVDEILERITPVTRMIMIASPNNPIGDYMRRNDFIRLVEKTPNDVLILYDGAYADYIDAEDYDPGFSAVEHAPNVVVTRTFSKLYGLAGLRIGWLYCAPSVLDPVQRIRTPFNANIAALAAAEAAVRDKAHTEKVREHNALWLKRIRDKLTALGLFVFPTVANFYLIRFDETGPFTAEKAAAFLMARGIIPRPVNAGGPAGCLRITVGLEHENEAVIEALTEFLSSKA